MAMVAAMPAWAAEVAPVTECDSLAQPPKGSMGLVSAPTEGVACAARAADKAGDIREAARLNNAATAGDRRCPGPGRVRHLRCCPVSGGR